MLRSTRHPYRHMRAAQNYALRTRPGVVSITPKCCRHCCGAIGLVGHCALGLPLRRAGALHAMRTRPAGTSLDQATLTEAILLSSSMRPCSTRRSKHAFTMLSASARRLVRPSEMAILTQPSRRCGRWLTSCQPATVRQTLRNFGRASVVY